jgi:hypothetical protein
MIFLIVKLLLFLGVTISFGYISSSLLLEEKKISILVPFSILIGLGGYMFLVNAVSYVVPIKEAVWLVLIGFGVFSASQLLSKGIGAFSPEIDFSKKELQILFGLALLVSVISGAVQLRAFDNDDLAHLSFASTISEGNFPVMNPMDPDTILSYHYGPDLLAAATHNVTQIPLLQDYDIQMFFFSGLTFLLSFLLAFYITDNFYTSIVASIFFFYGSGLLFLNITNGFSPLYHRYVLGEQVAGQWKFIADMLWPKISNFYTYAIRNYTSVMGTPIMLAVVYLYFKCVDENHARTKDAIFIGLLLGGLALSLETSFVILAFVLALILLWKIYLFTTSKDRVMQHHYGTGIRLIAGILFIGSAVAVLQGGILSASIESIGTRQVSSSENVQIFSLNKNPLELAIGSTVEDTIPLYSPTFLKEFGLLLLLFPIAVIVFRRDKKIIFLSSVGIVAFLIPILVIYVARPWEMARVFTVSTTIFSFVSALLVCFLFNRYKKSLKIKSALIVISLMVIFGGLAFQLVCMVTPFSNFGKIHVPFIASPLQPSILDSRVYEWIRINTVHSARFYPYSEILIFETGRMSPGYYLGLSPESKIPLYKDIADNCSAVSLKKLGINYLIVSPDGFSSETFSKKCSLLDAVLVFSATADSDYRDIYQLKN